MPRLFDELSTIEGFTTEDWLRECMGVEFNLYRWEKNGKKDVKVTDWKVQEGEEDLFGEKRKVEGIRTSDFLSPPNLGALFRTFFGSIDPLCHEDQQWRREKGKDKDIIHFESTLLTSGIPMGDRIKVTMGYTVCDASRDPSQSKAIELHCRTTIAFDVWGLSGPVESMIYDENVIGWREFVRLAKIYLEEKVGGRGKGGEGGKDIAEVKTATAVTPVEMTKHMEVHQQNRKIIKSAVGLGVKEVVTVVAAVTISFMLTTKLLSIK